MRDLYSRSGITLPDTAQVQPYGEVLAVGPQCTIAAVGDHVLFMPDCGPIGFRNANSEAEVFIIPEGSVFAKYTKDPAPLLS